MSNLNGQQFLPGMEDMVPQQAPRTTVRAQPATPGTWSGPMPGQLVMGVHNAVHGQPTSLSDNIAHKPFEIDQHGFVHEQTFMPNVMSRVVPSADKAAGNSSSRDLYRTLGGGQDKNEAVRAGWEQVPVSRVKSDTPVHTGQDYDTTEFKHTPNKPAGRERIEGIKESLRAGEDIREPAWMVKRSGRLYAMDGHHRIVAAREEGLPDYPARVRDLDAENKR
jgi:hypothetical protein